MWKNEKTFNNSDLIDCSFTVIIFDIYENRQCIKKTR